MQRFRGKGTRTLRPRAQLARAWILLPLLLAGPAWGSDLSDAQKLYDTGKYVDCITACEKAITAPPQARATGADPLAIPDLLPFAFTPPAVDGLWVLKARAELQLGRYADAEKTTDGGLQKNGENLSLALLRHRALLMSGREDEARALAAAVQDLATKAAWHFEDPENRVALGRFMLMRGLDARQVLETYFDKARRDDPRSLSAMLAIGDLALAKNDPGVAADAYEVAQRLYPDNPDIYFGLARANDDDPELISAAITKALEINPNHVESLLLVADNLINRERYKEAAETLEKILAVNPKEPRAWAARAVMAHVQGNHKAEDEARATALSTWKTNPEVDYLIGQNLSQKYRFEVGTSYQKKALAFDPDYEPAQFQLCQDLLRMGQEEEGWKLANQVFKNDPYNVMAYNLVTLHDRLAKFKTLSSPHFLVRMDAKEAPIYGQRVLDLLERAHEKFTTKYGVQLAEPTTIEIFPLQQDFEIRTFGFPGAEGFLGVCFGRVVTVNSPASRLAHPTSWEAVVWHEFCHTITLTKTHNKMPRWISEGISVYEERQGNPAWGEHMLPAYRELIRKDGATKLSELSQAFSQPPSPMHLQFAYFEASMVVEYLISRFGIDAIKDVLTDLGNDILINEALARHAEPIDKLDANFAAWLMQQADALAPKVDWTEPKLLIEDGSAPITAWNKDHPDSYWGLLFEAEAMILERKFAEAKVPLNKALALFPTYAEADSPYVLLAKVHRELNEAKDERDMLTKFTALNADAVSPRVRLMELAAADRDWKAVRATSEQALGVDPLTSPPYRYLANAAEALGDRTTAIAARRILLLMDPLDKPEQHYRLARLLFEDGKLPEARHEVNLSLEYAPRYRDALALLLQIADKMGPLTPPPTIPATTPALPGSGPASTGPTAEVRVLQEQAK